MSRPYTLDYFTRKTTSEIKTTHYLLEVLLLLHVSSYKFNFSTAFKAGEINST